MSTEKQTAANRRNAEKSTGPKTEAGKQRSSQNALIHGVCSTQMIIPGEDPRDVSDHLKTFFSEHPPEQIFRRRCGAS